MQAKVADFGLSKKNLEDEDLSYTMGSVAWMAPEVIASAKQFSSKSDVYSYGVICWELFTGEDPCPEDMAHVNLANKVLHEEWRPTIPEDVPIVWSELIQECWAHNPENRPSFSEMLAILESIENNPPFPMGPVDAVSVLDPEDNPDYQYNSLVRIRDEMRARNESIRLAQEKEVDEEDEEESNSIEWESDIMSESDEAI